MALAISGVNTGIIRHENNFAALALKIKHPKNKQSLLFFPLVPLKDFLLALEHRLALQGRSAGEAKEQQRKAIEAASKKMHKHIPPFEESEMQPADVGLRVDKVTLLENKGTDLIFTFQQHNGSTVEVAVNEHQIELLVTAMIHAINNAGLRDIALSLSSLLDFLPLFDVEFKEGGNIEYDSYQQEVWKQTLFSQHQALVYCYTDENGEKQYSGTVIKTRSPSNSEEMASISRRVLDYSHRLNKLKGKPCQVSVRTLASGVRGALTLEQSMRGLHLVQQHMQQESAKQ